MNTENPRAFAIGVDFDNTLISYDNVMHELAVQQGLINRDSANNKKLIRDQIRLLPGGEDRWQLLQAMTYGPNIGQATLINGVVEFFTECQRQRIPVYIVSH